MPRFRDAETGEYISKEETEQRNPATWVQEEDEAQHRADLKAIYKRCEANAITPENSIVFNNTASISLVKLKEIFNDYGAGLKE